jgi:hypothetical protein
MRAHYFRLAFITDRVTAFAPIINNNNNGIFGLRTELAQCMGQFEARVECAP